MRAIIDGSFTLAFRYYEMFPLEPSRLPALDMAIEQTIAIAHINLEAVLEQMRTASADGEQVVLLLAHGNDQGFAMPIIAGGRVSAMKQALEVIVQVEDTLKEVERIRALSDERRKKDAWKTLIRRLEPSYPTSREDFSVTEAEEWFEGRPAQQGRQAEPGWLLSTARDVLRMPLQRLKTVIQKVQQVRGRLERIEVRACNMGAKPETLEFFRRFFGVRLFLAPSVTVFDVLVVPNIERDDRRYSDWKRRNARPIEGIVYGRQPGPTGRSFLVTAFNSQEDGFLLKIWETSETPHKFQSSAAVRSWEIVQIFITTKIMVSSRYRGRGPFPLIGLWTFNTPGQSQPYVLPKEPAYRALIMSAPPLDIGL